MISVFSGGDCTTLTVLTMAGTELNLALCGTVWTSPHQKPPVCETTCFLTPSSQFIVNESLSTLPNSPFSVNKPLTTDCLSSLNHTPHSHCKWPSCRCSLHTVQCKWAPNNTLPKLNHTRSSQLTVNDSHWKSLSTVQRKQVPHNKLPL